MLMDWPMLRTKYRLDGQVTGVIHCGARLGEEAEDYEAAGIHNVWWVDGNPEVQADLRAKVEPLGHSVVEAILSDRDGVPTTLHVTNVRGLSSSVLQFGTHRQFSPDMVFERDVTAPSRTVDSLVAEHGITGCNMLAMDLQGYELHCLRGATKFLAGVDFVMSEVNNDEVYVGCARVEQLDRFLAAYGLLRAETQWVGDQGWGDAMYVNRSWMP